MWVDPWEALTCLKFGLEGCKWLGRFNAIVDIQDIKRANADVESSTTTVGF